MSGPLAAPLAELHEFDLPLHGLLILGGIVIRPLAYGALQADQLICALGLGHSSVRLLVHYNLSSLFCKPSCIPPPIWDI